MFTRGEPTVGDRHFCRPDFLLAVHERARQAWLFRRVRAGPSLLGEDVVRIEACRVLGLVDG